MRIHLDNERCQGHGRCYTLADDLFGYDDDGYATVLVDGELSPEQLEKAQLAAANCPEYAITVE